MRIFAAVVSIVLVAATLEPVTRDPVDDGYPLSTYPMFARARPTQLRMTYGLGVTRDGGWRYLSPWIAGSAEVLQARAIFERAVGQGRKGLEALCQQMARRIVTLPAFDDVVAIRIVDGNHDSVEYLVRGKHGTERERFRCPVAR